MTLKPQKMQLGKTTPLFEHDKQPPPYIHSEFGAVLTVSCICCGFSGIKVLEDKLKYHLPVSVRSHKYFHVIGDNMPPLSILLKPSSGLCNMSCDYCFYCDEMEKRDKSSLGFMTEDTLKNIIRRTLPRAEGGISYAYQGGEPTLSGLEFFEKAIYYQKKYNKNNLPINNALQTNGYSLNEDWCRFLKENNFLLGVSVDGTREIHNAYRHNKLGEGTYDKVLDGIRQLDRYQVDYNILTVVNRKTAANIEEIYMKYKKNNWNYQQYIACLDPLEENHGQNEYALSPEEYGSFLIRLFHLWYEDCLKGRQPYIRQFENYIGILMGLYPEACDQSGVCGLQYVAEADGSVYPCDFYMLDKYWIGNFNQDQLDIIDRNRETIRFIETSQKISKACKECPYHYLCRGGCQRNRDFNEQSGVYDNYFCKSFFQFFEIEHNKLKKAAKIYQESHI